MTRDEKVSNIQTEARLAWEKANSKGLICIATGVGKSKIGVDIAVEGSFLGVPTEKLKNKNWKEEFIRWGKEDLYNTLHRECYASMSKIKGNHYPLVILDECQFITEKNFEFFKNNTFDKVLMLTATPPDEWEKKTLLDKLGKLCYTYSLEQAWEDEVLPRPKIKVVETQLDDRVNYIKAGSKANNWLTTEYKYYQYLNKTINRFYGMNNSKAALVYTYKRMHFLYNLMSKTEIAKVIINKYLKDKRSLIFCGNTAQADELCKHSYHTNLSKTDRDSNYNLFINEEINHLSCVKALNTGVNLPLLDGGLIVQMDSKERNIVQRNGKHKLPLSI